MGVQTTRNQPRKVSIFLKDNGTQFRSDLALGSGHVMHDFAKMMAIHPKDIPQFEKKLRTNRKFISSFCDPKNITPDRTKELIAWVDRYYPIADI